MGVNGSRRLTFHGATKTVTGSRYLLESDNCQVLIDCGLFQGKKELRLKNWNNPTFDPQALDAILITHAHIDHTGYLPLVVRQGYRGPIYCTEATRELLHLLLLDSAHLQEEEARFHNAHQTSKHHPAKPLYNSENVQQTLSLLRPIPKNKLTEILPQVSVMARVTGHILGAVSLSIDFFGRRVCFSGDVGRYDEAILPDPEGIELGDVLVCESTYGDRLHPEENPQQEFGRALREGIERGGPIIIPAFAIGRTQTLLYYLGELERAGKVPVVPVYVDSPMAVDTTSIYSRFQRDFDAEATSLVDAGFAPLASERLTFCRSVEDSKRLNTLKGPRIIISASGMVNGGRVLHHMRNYLGDESATVIFVGFQAEGTRGQLIQSGAPTLKIFGAQVPVRAKIETIPGLSAHGDRDELLRWLKSCNGTPKQVRIVHGEIQPATKFAESVQQIFGWRAQPAEFLETLEF